MNRAFYSSETRQNSLIEIYNACNKKPMNGEYAFESENRTVLIVIARLSVVIQYLLFPIYK